MSFSKLVRPFIAFAAAGLIAGQAQAQVRSVDPNTMLAPIAGAPAAATAPVLKGEANTSVSADTGLSDMANKAAQSDVATAPVEDATLSTGSLPTDTAVAGVAPTTPAAAGTYRKDDLIGAAEGVFGKGAEGLANLIEKILKDQGQPNAYIAGREASGAFVVGLRYGSGTMSHTVEGTRPVYWTGPSLGFDVGGDATKVFVLAYNLYDSQDLYRRFPQAEGRAYFVGGFSATYLRRGNIVLIPVRLGVGVRLGANVGYMKFSEKSRWLPF